MRRYTILSPESRSALFDPPDNRDDVQWRYALVAEDVALAKRRRRSQNRLGFAIQLALIRDLGRPLRVAESLSNAIIDVVSEQLGVNRHGIRTPF